MRAGLSVGSSSEPLEGGESIDRKGRKVEKVRCAGVGRSNRSTASRRSRRFRKSTKTRHGRPTSRSNASWKIALTRCQRASSNGYRSSGRRTATRARCSNRAMRWWSISRGSRRFLPGKARQNSAVRRDGSAAHRTPRAASMPHRGPAVGVRLDSRFCDVIQRLGAPAPRFSALRLRAASINTRRIICAASPRKCARLSGLARDWSTRRRYASWASAVVTSARPTTPAQLAMREPPHFLVNQGDQLIQRLAIPSSPADQQPGDVIFRTLACSPVPPHCSW